MSATNNCSSDNRTYRQTDTHTQTDRHIDRHTETDRQTDTHTQTSRQTLFDREVSNSAVERRQYHRLIFRTHWQTLYTHEHTGRQNYSCKMLKTGTALCMIHYKVKCNWGILIRLETDIFMPLLGSLWGMIEVVQSWAQLILTFGFFTTAPLLFHQSRNETLKSYNNTTIYNVHIVKH